METIAIKPTTKPYVKTYGKFIREVNLEEMLKIRPSQTVVISVILNVPRYNAELKRTDMMTVAEERKNHYNAPTTESSRIAEKQPGGSMINEDIDFYSTAIRELLAETGHVVEEWKFLRAVQISSTKPGIDHYKVFLSGKNPKWVAEITEHCVREVLWRGAKRTYETDENGKPTTKVKDEGIQHWVPYDQRLGHALAMQEATNHSSEIAWDLMNYPFPPEGRWYQR